VTLDTSKGKIVLELYADKAPKTVANFLHYVRQHHYDGTIFHRVIAGFMVQGGGFDAKGVEKPTGAPIQNESRNGVSNERGTIAMARTSEPNSATAQFFINVVDNKRLDGNPANWGYTAFGKVIEGMDVVDAIAAVPGGDPPRTLSRPSRCCSARPPSTPETTDQPLKMAPPPRAAACESTAGAAPLAHLAPPLRPPCRGARGAGRRLEPPRAAPACLPLW
jgi:cyclophilin family peptidyl-prolyl cis-trans isomerase